MNDEESSNPLEKCRKYLLDNDYFRLFCVLFYIANNGVELFAGWWIIHDGYRQENGLVHGPINRNVLGVMSAFTAIQSFIFILELYMRARYVFKQTDTWFWSDLLEVLSIWITEGPLGILNLSLSMCQESSFSLGLLVKMLIFVLMLINSSVKFTMGCLEQCCGDTSKKDIVSKCEQDSVRESGSGILQKCWSSLHFFHTIGLILVLAINSAIFELTIFQSRNGPLEWHRINDGSKSKLLDWYTNKYLAEVDVFLPFASTPWTKNAKLDSYVHVDSIERIIRQGNEQKFRLIEFAKLKPECGSLQVYSQSSMFAELKQERASCFQQNPVNESLFEEKACPEKYKRFEGNPVNEQNPCIDEAVAISLTYTKPSPIRPYGTITYQAWIWSAGGKKKVEALEDLIYARNTVPHQKFLKEQEFSPTRTLENHQHMDRVGGPFKLEKISKETPKFFSTYTLQQGDMIPIETVWRTGFSLCPSVASRGPTWQKMTQKLA
ncbi:hypothetical protein Ciccas_008598 [Cichlidogyrus casuarinus]|uniref:Uncharacterized protein n=1 Tax=Cichlidogyrus casuarinus TaxID=1844966 RepID=A0ABD2Q121_9PLAT